MTKEQKAEYNKRYYLKNKEKWEGIYETQKESQKEYKKKYAKENRQLLKGYGIQWRKDGHYSVYLLPKENYVGMTEQIKARMHNHKYYGNDTTDYKVLHTFNSKKEALKKEAEYHEMGYKGKSNYIKN